MHAQYTEILEAMGEPMWWDEFAVPRYVDFSPKHAANIYADEVVLLEIACQNCDERFLVCMSNAGYAKAQKRDWANTSFPPHYGDPPNSLGCCPAGPTMNCVLIRVVERWQREKSEWSKVERFDFEVGVGEQRTQTEEE